MKTKNAYESVLEAGITALVPASETGPLRRLALHFKLLILQSFRVNQLLTILAQPARLYRVKTGIIRGFFRQSKTADNRRYGGTCTKVINTLDFWHHSWCGGGAYTSRQRQKRHLKVGKETPLENTNHLWIRRDTAVSGRIFSEFR